MTKLPRAYWRLGEPSGTAVVDEANRYPGTYSGSPTLAQTGAVTGDTDTAVTFASGSSQHADMGDVVDFDYNDSFTIAGFFKTSSTNQQSIVSKQESATNYRGWNVFLDSTSKYLNFSLSSVVTTDDLVVQVQTAFNDGNWHFFMITYDGTFAASGIKIYVDGDEQTVTSVRDGLDSTETTVSTAKLNIGGRNSADMYFTGTIDDIALFSYVLTAKDFHELYNMARGYTAYPWRVLAYDPEIYLRLGELSGTTAYDSSHNAVNGNINGSPVLNSPPLIDSESNTSYLFDKTAGDQYVEFNALKTGPLFSDGQTMSIGCWFSSTDASTDGLAIFSAHYSDYSDYLVIYLNKAAAGQITIQTNSDTAQSYGSALNDGFPHFVCVVFSASTTCEVYIDGKFMGSYSNTSITWSVVAYLSLGQEWDASAVKSNFFDGQLAEFFLTKQILTARNVNDLWAHGNDILRQQEYKSIIHGIRPASWWRFSEPSASTTALDLYGLYDAGYINGPPPLEITGAVSGDSDTAVTISGNDYISVGTSVYAFDVTDSFTISMWFSSSSTGTNKILISNRATYVPNRGYEIGVNASNELFVSVCNYASTAEVLLTYGIASELDGNWHHVSVTYDGAADGTTMRIYLDGVLVSHTVTTDTLTTAQTIVSASSLHIGARSGAVTWQGNLDECMIFDRELTDEECRRIYYAAVGKRYHALKVWSFDPAGYWRLGDASGTVTDETGNNDGTASGSPTYGATGLIDAEADDAMTFTRASTQRIDIASATIAAGLTDFTINAFIKPTDALTNQHRIWQESAAANEACALFINASGAAEFLIRYSATNYSATSSGTDITLTTSRVYMLTARLDSAGGMSIFVNGLLAGTDSNTNPSDEVVADVDIAAKVLATAAYMAGDLDEVAVMQTALSDTQIEELYYSSMAAAYLDEPGSFTNFVVESADMATVMVNHYGATVVTSMDIKDALGILNILETGITVSTVLEAVFQFFKQVTESIAHTDAVVSEPVKVVLESLTIGEVHADQLRAAQIAVEQMTVYDFIYLTWELVAADSVNIADANSVIAQRAVTVLSLLTASGIVTENTHLAQVITEAVILQAIHEWKFDEAVVDSAAFTSAVINLYRAVQSEVSSIVNTDTALGTNRVGILTLDSVDLTDAVSWNQRLNGEFEEAIAVGGTLVLDDTIYSAVVLNADTLAPSEYTNFPFNSFGKMGSTNLGATDTAIYALTGDDDDGIGIDAVVRTGLINFGTTQFKRVPRAYLGYTSDGALVLKTIGTGGTADGTGRGTKVERWYELTPRTADAPATARIKLGRGVKATYWQFELTNKDGADFDVAEIKLLPVVLSRRV